MSQSVLMVRVSLTQSGSGFPADFIFAIVLGRGGLSTDFQVIDLIFLFFAKNLQGLIFLGWRLSNWHEFWIDFSPENRQKMRSNKGSIHGEIRRNHSR